MINEQTAETAIEIFRAIVQVLLPFIPDQSMHDLLTEEAAKRQEAAKVEADDEKFGT